MPIIQGESWDLASEYPAADSPELEADLEKLGSLLDEIERRNAVLVPALEDAPNLAVEGATALIAEARAVFALTEDAATIVHDAEGYAECSLSVDSQDAAAQALLGRLQALEKRFSNAAEPLSQFLDLRRMPWWTPTSTTPPSQRRASSWAIRGSADTSCCRSIRRRSFPALPRTASTPGAGSTTSSPARSPARCRWRGRRARWGWRRRVA